MNEIKMTHEQRIAKTRVANLLIEIAKNHKKQITEIAKQREKPDPERNTGKL